MKNGSGKESTSEVKVEVLEASKIENENMKPSENASLLNTDRLSLPQKIAFGLGHVINDVSAALWFSYTLLFLQFVIGFSPAVGAFLIFLGQVVDALATPIIGALVDRFGSRKKWNIFGVVTVAVTFPMIFQMRNPSDIYSILYYAIIIVIFQVAFAVVQLSHLSLIPELTPLPQERAKLTAFRYIASVTSNVTVYLVAYWILRGRSGSETIIGPMDGRKFLIVALVATGIGLVCSVIFLRVLTMPFVRSTPIRQERIFSNLWETAKMFCKEGQLYVVALIHTISRLVYTLSLVYMPFFINEVAITDSGTLAVAPLLCFLASLCASITLNYISDIVTNQKTLFIHGAFFFLLGSLVTYLNPDAQDTAAYIYVASILYGIGSSVTIISSLCITANLIGCNTECGAFIYSVITFSDKLLNGFAVLVIEYLKSTCSDAELCEHYYKFVLTYITGALSLIGLVLLLVLPKALCVGKN